jgi:hypothetical protein
VYVAVASATGRRNNRAILADRSPLLRDGFGSNLQARKPTGETLAFGVSAKPPAGLFAVYTNGLQFISIVYVDWSHTDRGGYDRMERQKMRSLSRDELAYREATKRRCQGAMDQSTHAPHPTESQIVFEIGVTLAAVLSIAVIGNLLSVWLGG